MAQIPGRLLADLHPNGTVGIVFIASVGGGNECPLTARSLDAAEIDFVTCGLTPRCIGSAARRVPYPQSTIARIVVCSDPGMER